jgi:hypothetical protein
MNAKIRTKSEIERDYLIGMIRDQLWLRSLLGTIEPRDVWMAKALKVIGDTSNLVGAIAGAFVYNLLSDPALLKAWREELQLLANVDKETRDVTIRLN